MLHARRDGQVGDPVLQEGAPADYLQTLGQFDHGKVGLAEGPLADDFQRGREADLVQARAALEGAGRDLLQAVRQGDRTQAAAVAESAAPEAFQARRQFDMVDVRGVVERAVADLLQAGGNDELPDPAEAVERALTDDLQPGGQLHGADPVRAGEVAALLLHDGGDGMAVDLTGKGHGLIIRGRVAGDHRGVVGKQVPGPAAGAVLPVP